MTVLLSLTVFLNTVSQTMPNTSDAVPLISELLVAFVQSPFQDLILISRHLLQLHYDDGGEQRGVDGGGAQLPPQDRGDPRDADVGPQCLSPVASVDSSDGPTGKINIPIK